MEILNNFESLNRLADVIRHLVVDLEEILCIIGIVFTGVHSYSGIGEVGKVNKWKLKTHKEVEKGFPEAKEMIGTKYVIPDVTSGAELLSLFVQDTRRISKNKYSTTDEEMALVTPTLLEIFVEVFKGSEWECPENWKSRRNVVSTVLSTTWRASPGYPHYIKHPTNKDLFKREIKGVDISLDKNRLRWAFQKVKARLGNRLSPIRTFIKRELHPVEKWQQGRWRIIASVEIIDQIVGKLLFSPWNKNIANDPYSYPIKAGYAPEVGGMHEFMTRMVPEQVLESDKSGWDQMSALFPYVFDLLLREKMCKDKYEPWYYEHAYYSQVYTESMYKDCEWVTTGGHMFQQEVSGLQKSGCINTLYNNSVGNLMVAALALLRLGYSKEEVIKRIKGACSMGDDLVIESIGQNDLEHRKDSPREEIVEDMIVYQESAGCVFKTHRDISYKDLEFCSSVAIKFEVRPGVIRWMPVPHRKGEALQSQICKALFHVDTEFLLSNLQALMRLWCTHELTFNRLRDVAVRIDPDIVLKSRQQLIDEVAGIQLQAKKPSIKAFLKTIPALDKLIEKALEYDKIAKRSAYRDEKLNMELSHLILTNLPDGVVPSTDVDNKCERGYTRSSHGYYYKNSDIIEPLTTHPEDQDKFIEIRRPRQEKYSYSIKDIMPPEEYYKTYVRPGIIYREMYGMPPDIANAPTTEIFNVTKFLTDMYLGKDLSDMEIDDYSEEIEPRKLSAHARWKRNKRIARGNATGNVTISSGWETRQRAFRASESEVNPRNEKLKKRDGTAVVEFPSWKNVMINNIVHGYETNLSLVRMFPTLSVGVGCPITVPEYATIEERIVRSHCHWPTIESTSKVPEVLHDPKYRWIMINRKQKCELSLPELGEQALVLCRNERLTEHYHNDIINIINEIYIDVKQQKPIAHDKERLRRYVASTAAAHRMSAQNEFRLRVLLTLLILLTTTDAKLTEKWEGASGAVWIMHNDEISVRQTSVNEVYYDFDPDWNYLIQPRITACNDSDFYNYGNNSCRAGTPYYTPAKGCLLNHTKWLDNGPPWLANETDNTCRGSRFNCTRKGWNLKMDWDGILHVAILENGKYICKKIPFTEGAILFNSALSETTYDQAVPVLSFNAKASAAQAEAVKYYREARRNETEGAVGSNNNAVFATGGGILYSPNVQDWGDKLPFVAPTLAGCSAYAFSIGFDRYVSKGRVCVDLIFPKADGTTGWQCTASSGYPTTTYNIDLTGYGKPINYDTEIYLVLSEPGDFAGGSAFATSRHFNIYGTFNFRDHKMDFVSRDGKIRPQEGENLLVTEYNEDLEPTQHIKITTSTTSAYTPTGFATRIVALHKGTVPYYCRYTQYDTSCSFNRNPDNGPYGPYTEGLRATATYSGDSIWKIRGFHLLPPSQYHPFDYEIGLYRWSNIKARTTAKPGEVVGIQSPRIFPGTDGSYRGRSTDDIFFIMPTALAKKRQVNRIADCLVLVPISDKYQCITGCVSNSGYRKAPVLACRGKSGEHLQFVKVEGALWSNATLLNHTFAGEGGRNYFHERAKSGSWGYNETHNVVKTEISGTFEFFYYAAVRASSDSENAYLTIEYYCINSPRLIITSSDHRKEFDLDPLHVTSEVVMQPLSVKYTVQFVCSGEVVVEGTWLPSFSVTIVAYDIYTYFTPAFAIIAAWLMTYLKKEAGGLLLMITTAMIFWFQLPVVTYTIVILGSIVFVRVIYSKRKSVISMRERTWKVVYIIVIMTIAYYLLVKVFRPVSALSNKNSDLFNKIDPNKVPDHIGSSNYAKEKVKSKKPQFTFSTGNSVKTRYDQITPNNTYCDEVRCQLDFTHSVRLTPGDIHRFCVHDPKVETFCVEISNISVVSEFRGSREFSSGVVETREKAISFNRYYGCYPSSKHTSYGGRHVEWGTNIWDEHSPCYTCNCYINQCYRREYNWTDNVDIAYPWPGKTDDDGNNMTQYIYTSTWSGKNPSIFKTVTEQNYGTIDCRWIQFSMDDKYIVWNSVNSFETYTTFSITIGSHTTNHTITDYSAPIVRDHVSISATTQHQHIPNYETIITRTDTGDTWFTSHIGKYHPHGGLFWLRYITNDTKHVNATHYESFLYAVEDVRPHIRLYSTSLSTVDNIIMGHHGFETDVQDNLDLLDDSSEYVPLDEFFVSTVKRQLSWDQLLITAKPKSPTIDITVNSIGFYTALIGKVAKLTECNIISHVYRFASAISSSITFSCIRSSHDPAPAKIVIEGDCSTPITNYNCEGYPNCKLTVSFDITTKLPKCTFVLTANNGKYSKEFHPVINTKVGDGDFLGGIANSSDQTSFENHDSPKFTSNRQGNWYSNFWKNAWNMLTWPVTAMFGKFQFNLFGWIFGYFETTVIILLVFAVIAWYLFLKLNGPHNAVRYGKYVVETARRKGSQILMNSLSRSNNKVAKPRKVKVIAKPAASRQNIKSEPQRSVRTRPTKAKPVGKVKVRKSFN
jgi:hypothetical protein